MFKHEPFSVGQRGRRLHAMLFSASYGKVVADHIPHPVEWPGHPPLKVLSHTQHNQLLMHRPVEYVHPVGRMVMYKVL